MSNKHLFNIDVGDFVMKNDKYYKFELNMGLANIIAIVEFIILVVLNYIFDFVNMDNMSYALVLAVIILYTVIHEVLHGIAFSLNAKDKSKIKYGAMLEKGVFYAACQEDISKKAIIVSLLFPTIILTVIPLPFSLYFHLDLLTICALYNFIGAIGDLMMTYFIIRLPKEIRYIDYDITVGATFISDEDLEAYSSKVMKLIEKGNHKKSNIDTSIKKIYISKASVTTLLILLAIIGASFVFDMI